MLDVYAQNNDFQKLAHCFTKLASLYTNTAEFEYRHRVSASIYSLLSSSFSCDNEILKNLRMLFPKSDPIHIVLYDFTSWSIVSFDKIHNIFETSLQSYFFSSTKQFTFEKEYCRLRDVVNYHVTNAVWL